MTCTLVKKPIAGSKQPARLLYLLKFYEAVNGNVYGVKVVFLKEKVVFCPVRSKKATESSTDSSRPYDRYDRLENEMIHTPAIRDCPAFP